MKEKYAGSNWIEGYLHRRGEAPMSEFGKKIADLLGEWQHGIYHIEKEVTHKRVQWFRNDWITVVIGYSTLCTFDSDRLTSLVILAHKYKTRVEMQAKSFNHFELSFYNSGVFGGHKEHPGLPEFVETIKSYE